jgi:hypothetical protein
MISFLQRYFQSKVNEDFLGQNFTYFCFQNYNGLLFILVIPNPIIG